MSPVLCPLTHLAVVELDTKVFCARREGAARGPWRERWEERGWMERGEELEFVFLLPINLFRLIANR